MSFGWVVWLLIYAARRCCRFLGACACAKPVRVLACVCSLVVKYMLEHAFFLSNLLTLRPFIPKGSRGFAETRVKLVTSFACTFVPPTGASRRR